METTMTTTFNKNMNNLQSLLDKHNYSITAHKLISQIYNFNYKDIITGNNFNSVCYEHIKIDIDKIGTFITDDDFKVNYSGNKYILLRNECIYYSFGNSKDYLEVENYEAIQFFEGRAICQACNETFSIEPSIFNGSICSCGLINLNFDY